MEPFRTISSLAAPLDRTNVDTDQIIPKQFLKRIERTGYGEFLFFDWRRTSNGDPDPEFELNDPRYRGARILIAGKNFGCGSSREHAPWALMDFGITCVISSSFADIFYNNCFSNGLLPVVLKPDEVHALMGEAKGGNHVFSIDLESQSVTAPSGATFRFDIDPSRKEKMLKGLDAIGETLEHAADIDRFEEKRRMTRVWAA